MSDGLDQFRDVPRYRRLGNVPYDLDGGGGTPREGGRRADSPPIETARGVGDEGSREPIRQSGDPGRDRVLPGQVHRDRGEATGIGEPDDEASGPRDRDDQASAWRGAGGDLSGDGRGPAGRDRRGAGPDPVELAHLYDDVADDYDDRWSRNVDRAEDDFLFRKLLKPLADDARVLDLGCGTGHLLDFADPAAYLGVDVSVGMLEVARAKHSASGLAAHGIGEPGAPWQRPRNFVQSEVSNVAEFTPESTWDLVCATWAFSYFPDQHAVLDAAYRGLVQGGVCVVHGMSARYARRDSYVLKGDGSYDPTTASKLAWQMRLAGFKHVRVRGFRFLPDNPLFELIPTSLLTRLLQLETEYLPAEWGLTHFAIGVRL